MARLTSLEQLRALIDDADGVAVGRLPALLDDMAKYCNIAMREQEEMQNEIDQLTENLDKAEERNAA